MWPPATRPPGRGRTRKTTFGSSGFRTATPTAAICCWCWPTGWGGTGAARTRAAWRFRPSWTRSGEAAGGVGARLRVSLDAANAAVGRYAADQPRYAGMGCTLVACVVTDGAAAHWISVGDSPLWRLRGADERGLDRLNADHSMRPVFEDLVRLGRMAEDEVDGGAAHQLRSGVDG